ncbi:glycosyl hydrolase family 5 [Fibrobacter sp. UWB11]|uniref:glycosyl hydrolase family 5 n=1 Tax=Fibrobacter sp. UWB11 TaxID=1896202 RepID=UPI00092A21C9|nr:glycosyl hydrolase family 5 [Fibrobacter sp. UWB11]SIO34206.1 Glycosyl hydrolase family 45 [Fibrobacter sp. UWB11]
MKYPFLRSLLSLGTIILACSCSDDKSPSNGSDVSIIPCEDAWYLQEQGLLMYKDQRVTDLAGNQVGKLVPIQGTLIAIVKDMAGNTIIPQVDLAKTPVIPGDAARCNTNPQPDASISTCVDAWYLVADKKYLLYADLTVTDEAGTQVGTIVATSGSTLVNVVDMSGKPVVNNIDLNTLPLIHGDNVRYKILEPAFHLKDATGDYVIYQNTVVTMPDGTPIGYADFTTNTIKYIDMVTVLTTTSNILTLPILTPGAKCVDYTAPVVSSSSQQPIVSSSSTYIPPNPNSSSSKPKSSSSQPKSSSSAPPPSSSSAPVTGKCPTIKTKGNGGSGWATRYWDCCKPHCSWPEHSGGNFSKQCTNKGKSANTNWGDGSICSGGPQMTCTSQIPFTIDGCTEMAFAFAAVPAANGGSCGKCFQLTFTGTGKYSNDANIKRLKGKKLIIMATNVGGDVQQGQFDIMIPGGGVGMFNGCSSMGWGSQGAQYGGLLSDCETETKYAAGKYKSCLTEKCNKSFANDEEAKKGCLFLATWMEAAGNPNHEYVEVECPQVLKDKY